MLKVNALPVSAQVIDLKTFHNRAIGVFIVPLVGVDFLAMLVLEGAVSRRVKCPSPLPASALYL